MRQVVLVLCLFGLIYGQNYYQLYNGYQQSGSVYSGSSVCYALSGTTGNTMTVEVVAENAISLYVASASCSLDNYSYLVQNPVDGDRYTSAYVVNSTGNNYFVVYSNVYSSFTIKATTGTSVQLSTNQTYSGYAPSNSYLYFSFYATYDSFDVSITGTESTFYLKQNQMASYNNYDMSFYVDSAYSQVNSVGPCSNYVNNNAIGHWYIAVRSYYGSSFTIDINTPSASAFNPTSLTSGYNYVLLNYGYNYFQIAATANYGVELATTDYNSYSVQIAPLSSCTPVSWPYSASLSSTQSVVFYPNSTQVISIYSWQTAHYAYLDVTLISTLSTSGALPLTSSQYYYVALGDNNTMAYFSYDSTYAFTLSFNNYINVYVKQGSLPTPTDYDYFYPSLYYSQTVDPCNYLNYVNGETFYIGISYPIVSTVSISAYTSSYSTCYNNPYASSGDVGLIVGLSVGGFVLISLFVFLIVHFVRRRRFHHHHPSYAPLRKHNYVAVTTMPLDTYNTVRPPTAPPMIYQNYMPNGVSTAVPPPYMPPANNSYVQNNSYVPPPYAPSSNQQ